MTYLLSFRLTLPLLFFVLLPQSMAAGLIRDTELETGLQELAAPLVKAAAFAPNSIDFRIVIDSSYNAFVAGKMVVYLHSGLLLDAKSPEEILGVIAHELGPPNSSSSLNQGTYVFEGSVSSMTAISNYIFVQEQNEEIIHTFSSNEINPTRMYIDQGNSDLYVSEKSNPDIYLLSILEKTGYALSYKTIGIMHYSQ